MIKQRIDFSQLKEFTALQRQHLRELWLPQGGDAYIRVNRRGELDYIVMFFNLAEFRIANHKEFKLPLFSIGQCIDVLGYKKTAEILDAKPAELLDMLWEGVKERL